VAEPGVVEQNEQDIRRAAGRRRQRWDVGLGVRVVRPDTAPKLLIGQWQGI
jgi:hypothetical protein